MKIIIVCCKCGKGGNKPLRKFKDMKDIYTHDECLVEKGNPTIGEISLRNVIEEKDMIAALEHVQKEQEKKEAESVK